MNNLAPKITKELNSATLANSILQQDEWSGYNRASAIGWVDDCMRYPCLLRLCPEKAEENTIKRQRIFDEGNKQEWLMRKDMISAGFKIAPVNDRPLIDEDLKIKGEVDDLLKLSKSDIRPIDYKSCSSYMFQHISQFATADDLRSSQYYWVRHYPAQLYTYLHLYTFPMGLLLFKNKDSGETYPLDVPEDKVYFNQLKEKIHTVNKRVEKENPPAAEYKDVCSKCKFRDYCFPDKEAPAEEDSIERIEDMELEMMLKRRFELKNEVKEYKELDKKIKNQLKGRTIVIGDYMYKTSEYPRAGYDIPDDIKREFKYTFNATRVTIKHLKKAL